MSVITLITLLRKREGITLIIVGVLAIFVHLAYIKYELIAPVLSGLRTETAASHLLISAGYFLLRERLVRYMKPWMPVLALFAGFLCYLSALPWWAPIILSPFLLAFAINHLSEAAQAAHSALAAAPLRLFGLWSYSIYLWQQPVYKYKSLFVHGDAVLAFIVSVLLGLFSFYLIENPVRDWLNKVW